MRRLRIKGLVKVADSVRRELSQPLSSAQKKRLRETVMTSLRQVDRIVAKHGVTVDHFPEPTRRAYRFLATLDFDAITSQVTAVPDVAARGNVSLVGLKSYLDGVLASLAQPVPADKADELHEAIRSANENIEDHLQINSLIAMDLTTQCRSIRGWLAFFAERENFDAYLAAMQRARPAFESAIGSNARFSTPAVIEFRPTHGLYRVRGYSNATRAVLVTPMICFTDEQFQSVAEAAINCGPKQALVKAASSEEYQGIQAELEALCGVEERTAGIHRNLEASFNRVVATYFGGSLPRPRLTWSKAFTGRKFGHYDPVRDTVMISCTLDRADVPEYVLDSVMHHELLHKKLGVGWHSGRMTSHTPEFREQERLFTRLREAEAILRRLAGEM
ncbi:MAG: hypothetical protein ACE5HE_09620 [Phycisphaerae bacterium]